MTKRQKIAGLILAYLVVTAIQAVIEQQVHAEVGARGEARR